jgi:hypothetical protein
MTQVQAYQHIYTNVEQEQSPHKRGGFQTLFYTLSALTEAEVEEMETRLFYVRSEQEPVKRVFFTTSTGKTVVAQIVPLADPDRSGRKGRYLAHSLVFTSEMFAHLEADPFQVFRHVSFITTVEEALAQGEFQTGNIPVVSIDLPADKEHDFAAARAWALQEFKKLTLFALQADRLAHEQLTKAFVGEPPQVESALKAAFFAVPTPLRSQCTFDTYFQGGNLVATYYWAVGLPGPPSGPKYILVDARSLQRQGGTMVQAETAYERWVMHVMETNDLGSIARHKEHAFALCRWLEGHADGFSLLDAAPPQVVTSVFQVNPQQVRARLQERLQKYLPSVLMHRVFEHIYRQMDTPQLFRQLREGFALPQLLELLSTMYQTQGFRAPPREEREAVGVLLQQADHRHLRLFYLCWTGQRAQLRQRLAHLSADEYSQFVQTALRFAIVEPLACLIPGRGDTFLDLYLSSNTLRGHDLLPLVQALLEAREINSLSRLVSYLPGQSARELQALAKIITKQPDIPEPFQQAVSEAVAALPPLQGWKGFLHLLLSLRQEKSREER